MKKVLFFTIAIIISLTFISDSVVFADQGIDDVIDLNSVSTTRWQTINILDPFGRMQCGDGVVQSPQEECEPPNKEVPTNNSCGNGGTWYKTCNSNCQYQEDSNGDIRTCKSSSVCGNGIVEAGENCDDGELNGTYGHCAAVSNQGQQRQINFNQGSVGPQTGGNNVGQNFQIQAQGCIDPHPQYCGNGKLDYIDTNDNGTRDSSDNILEFCDTNENGKCESVNGIGDEDCSTYAVSSTNSCAADCQSRGGYCGDGEVNIGSDEECDDGNNKDGDGCSSKCKIEKQQQKKSDEPGVCGNNIINKNEKCDQGSRNGIKCDPKYGESCTYCAADCSEVLTVDPVAFCGNGQIDKIGTSNDGESVYESCELRSVSNQKGKQVLEPQRFCYQENFEEGFDGQFYSSGYEKTNRRCGGGTFGFQQCSTGFCGNPEKEGNTINCPDKGTYQCTNSCTNLNSNCTKCTEYDGRDSIPQVAVLNPLIAGNEKKYYTQGTLSHKWGTKGPNNTTKYGGFITLYRPYPPSMSLNSDKNESKGPYFGYRNFGQEDSSWNNPSSYSNILTKNGTSPISGRSIESDSLCSSSYKTYFSGRLIDRSIENEKGVESNAGGNSEFDESDVANDYGKPNSSDSNNDRNYNKYGDYFDYKVNGESGVIKNSYVTSPAVPPQTMRVVVKWTDKEANKFSGDSKGKFTGVLYSQKLPEKRVSYTKAISKKPKNYLSSDMKVQEKSSKDYWYPTNAPAFGGEENNSSIFVHDIGGVDDNSKIVQSMTITKPDEVSTKKDNGETEQLEDGEQIPFYVRPVGTPIQRFQNGELEVFIYTYKEDQVPLYSIYKPTYKFKIKNAQHSSNPLAAFWHVFNIKKVQCDGVNTWAIANTKGDIISPKHSNHGEIITRFSEIKSDSKNYKSNYNCDEIKDMDYLTTQKSESGSYDYNYQPNTWDTINYGGLDWFTDFNFDSGILRFDFNQF